MGKPREVSEKSEKFEQQVGEVQKNMDTKSIAEKVVPVLEPFGVKRIAIFGSFARGEELQESDIDILVEFDEPRKQPLGLLTWVRLERELSEKLGRKVDLVSYTGLRAPLRARIEREMVVI